MKLKMFLVIILTFILMPCIGYAEDYSFTNNSNMSDSQWETLYKSVCSSNAQRGFSFTTSGCKYYWGNNEETWGFSGNNMANNGHGCPNDSHQAAANFNPDPATCLGGTIEKFDLIGFTNINDVYTLLNNNVCSVRNCYIYVKNNYCNNWSSSDAICRELASFDPTNDEEDEEEEGDDTQNQGTNVSTCEELFDDTSAGKDLKKLIKMVIRIVFILVPIILIGLTTVDFTKAIFAGEDDMKKAQGKLFKRIMIAVIIFLIPTLIRLILWVASLVWPEIFSPDLCGLL